MAAQSTNLAPAGTDDEVMARLVRAQPAEVPDRVLQGDALHGDGALLADLRDAFRGRVGPLFVLDVLGGGADEDVAGCRGGDEHALAELGGQGKDGVADIARRRGVEHVVLAAPRGDAHAIALGGDEVVELVCVDPGGVDDHARSEAAFVRPYDPASAGAAIEAEDLLVESEVDAVDARALREGDGELKGVDDPRTRRP